MNLTHMQLLMKPSAFIPLGMSAIAFGMVLVHFFWFGIVRDADEGTAAHIFQLLIIAQVPFVLFFAMKWIARDTTKALHILMMQVAAALIAILAVVFLT